jgi:hypothetical protein
MKYLIITYIALGLTLSSLIGIEYHCDSPDMFPEYYGSPFIFKQKSLGSSLTYFYSISGILMNVFVWSVPLLIFNRLIAKLIDKRKVYSWVKLVYKGLVIVLIVFSTFNIALDYVMLGRGFEKESNYWYMNLDKEAKKWGTICEGKWIVFGKVTASNYDSN